MTRTARQDARRSGKEDAGHSLFLEECLFIFIFNLRVFIECLHLGSLTAANWVSFDFNVSYSSCKGYSLINPLKLKKKKFIKE